MLPQLELVYEALCAEPTLSCFSRGEGKSEFLYVSSISRAVEISLENNSYWIELWDNSDPESGDPPVREMEVQSEEEVTKVVRSWCRTSKDV